MTKRTRDAHDGTGDLDERLRARREPAREVAAFARARAALAERASAAGLVDVAFARHDSPLGPLVLGATEAGLVRVGLPAESEDAVLAELAARVSPRVLCAPRPALARARRELDAYFAGRRRGFEVALDWRLTAGFRRAVLVATAGIPYGRTATYREIAGRAGSPAAFRAAGSALATNPLPIVVPCHRVLPASGGIGDYRGGAAAKQLLLALEAGACEA